MRLNARLRRLEQHRRMVSETLDIPIPPYEELRKLPYEELMRLYTQVIQAPVPRARPTDRDRLKELARLPYEQLLEMYEACVGNSNGF